MAINDSLLTTRAKWAFKWKSMEKFQQESFLLIEVNQEQLKHLSYIEQIYKRYSLAKGKKTLTQSCEVTGA